MRLDPTIPFEIQKPDIAGSWSHDQHGFRHTSFLPSTLVFTVYPWVEIWPPFGWFTKLSLNQPVGRSRARRTWTTSQWLCLFSYCVYLYVFLVLVFCAYVVIVVLSMIIFYVLFIMCPCLFVCLFVSSRLTLSNYSTVYTCFPFYMFSYYSLLVALFICLLVSFLVQTPFVSDSDLIRCLIENKIGFLLLW